MKIPVSYSLPRVKVSALFEGGADLFGRRVKEGLDCYVKEDLERTTLIQLDYAILRVLIAAADSVGMNEGKLWFDIPAFGRSLGEIAVDIRNDELFVKGEYDA